MALVLTRGRSRAAQAQETQAKVAQTQKATEKIESYLAIDPDESGSRVRADQTGGPQAGGRPAGPDQARSAARSPRTWGFSFPPIRIRDQLRLEPNQYLVKIKGVETGRGEVMPGYCLAIDNGTAVGSLPGVETREPAFGLKAYWITDENRGLRRTAQLHGGAGLLGAGDPPD